MMTKLMSKRLPLPQHRLQLPLLPRLRRPRPPLQHRHPQIKGKQNSLSAIVKLGWPLPKTVQKVRRQSSPGLVPLSPHLIAEKSNTNHPKLHSQLVHQLHQFHLRKCQNILNLRLQVHLLPPLLKHQLGNSILKLLSLRTVRRYLT